MEPRCKKCKKTCPDVMPVNGPDAWSMDPDTYEPLCPTCTPPRKAKKAAPKDETHTTLHYTELTLLGRLCRDAGVVLDFEGIEVRIYMGNKKRLSLGWDYQSVEHCLFLKAWNRARRPRFPRHVPQEERYTRFDEFDDNDYRHEQIRRAVVETRKLPEDAGYVRYEQVLKEYLKLAAKSPLAGLSWAEPQMRKHFPWCSLSDTSARIIQHLNAAFQPYASLISYTEHLAGESYFEHAIAHYEDAPLVWHYKYTFGTDSITVLDAVRVRLYSDSLRVLVGDKTYRIASENDLIDCLRELKFRVDKTWLEAMDGLHPELLCVNTLARLALNRDPDTFDTSVYRVATSPKPTTYNLKDTLEPTPFVYLAMYQTTEVNLIKKEEN